MSYEVQKMGKIYYRTTYTDVLWSNPSISANGTLGGASFAVSPSSSSEGYSCWWSFVLDTINNDTTGWSSNTSASTLILYNPTPVKAYRFHGYWNWTSGQLYGSNDGTNWTQIQTFSYSVEGNYDMKISTINYYKYYKFNIVATVDGAKAVLGTLSKLMGYTQTTTTEVINTPDYTSTVDRAKGYEIISSSGKVYDIEKGV